MFLKQPDYFYINNNHGNLRGVLLIDLRKASDLVNGDVILLALELCYGHRNELVWYYDSTPCRAVPCRAVPCRAVPCRAVPCRAVPCRAVSCRAVPCHAMPSHITLHHINVCNIAMENYLNYLF